MQSQRDLDKGTGASLGYRPGHKVWHPPFAQLDLHAVEPKALGEEEEKITRHIGECAICQKIQEVVRTDPELYALWLEYGEQKQHPKMGRAA